MALLLLQAIHVEMIIPGGSSFSYGRYGVGCYMRLLTGYDGIVVFSEELGM